MEPWLRLRLYPALLALYAGGIAAVAASRYDNLAALLTGPRIKRMFEDDAEPLVLVVNSDRVMEIAIAKRMPNKEHDFVPFNDHLFLRSPVGTTLREYLPEEQEFIAAFDRFEYLLGLVYWDLNEKRRGPNWAWAPVGCFVWRHGARYELRRMRVVQEIGAEIAAAGTDWPLLKNGLFDRSIERLTEVKEAFNASISRRKFG